MKPEQGGAALIVAVFVFTAVSAGAVQASETEQSVINKPVVCIARKDTGSATVLGAINWLELQKEINRYTATLSMDGVWTVDIDCKGNGLSVASRIVKDK